MKNLKRIAPVFAVLLTLCMLLAAAGCGKNGDGGGRLAGTWTRTTAQNEKLVLEFRDDGTVTLNGEEAAYEILSDGKLKLKKNFYYEECSFSFNGSDTLILQCGDTVWHDFAGEYARVK